MGEGTSDDRSFNWAFTVDRRRFISRITIRRAHRVTNNLSVIIFDR